MKVALYARVSMEETDDGSRRYQDPENQLQPLREWCKTQNWGIVAEFVDRGSGADPSREQFRDMMNEAMQHKFDVIIVWKLDRFSREGISSVLGYIEKLRHRGVGIKSQTESWLDTSVDNPLSEMLIAIFAWVAKMEREKISQRTKAGIQRRKNIGQWHGGRPKGSKDRKPRKARISYEQYRRGERIKATPKIELIQSENVKGDVISNVV